MDNVCESKNIRKHAKVTTVTLMKQIQAHGIVCYPLLFAE